MTVAKQPRRVVLGQAPARPGGIALLTVKALRLARALGYPCWAEHSTSPDSATRYLRVRIDNDWPLKIRISDHILRRETGCDFELVSHDGIAGEVELAAFLHAVARGEIAR